MDIKSPYHEKSHSSWRVALANEWAQDENISNTTAMLIYTGNSILARWLKMASKGGNHVRSEHRCDIQEEKGTQM